MRNRYSLKLTSCLTLFAMLFSIASPVFLTADETATNSNNPYYDETASFAFEEDETYYIFVTPSDVVDHDTVLEDTSVDEFLSLVNALEDSTVDYYTGSTSASEYYDETAACNSSACSDVPDAGYSDTSSESRDDYDDSQENPSIASDQSSSGFSANSSYDRPAKPDVTVVPDYVEPPAGDPPTDAETQAYKDAVAKAKREAAAEEARIEAELQAKIDAKVKKVSDLSSKLSGLNSDISSLSSSINSKNNTAESKARSLSNARSSLKSTQTRRAAALSTLNSEIETRNANAEKAKVAAQEASDTTTEANRLEDRRVDQEDILLGVQGQVAITEGQVNGKQEQIPEVYQEIYASVESTTATVNALHADLNASIQSNIAKSEEIYQSAGIEQALYDLNLTYEELQQIVIDNPAEPVVPVLPNGETLKTDPSHPKYDELVSAIQYYQSLDEHSQNSPYEEVRKLRDLGRIGIEMADEAFASAQNLTGEQILEGAFTALDMTLDFVPGVSFFKDAVSIVTGVNPITGEEVSSTERTIMTAALFMPAALAGSAKIVTKVAKAAKNIVDKGKDTSGIADELFTTIKKSDSDLEVYSNLPCGNKGSLSTGIRSFGIQSAAAGSDPCGIGEITDDVVGKINKNGEAPDNTANLTGSGSAAHKAKRWQEYQDRHGDWSYERWSKTYDQNMVRATNAHKIADDYHVELGWGVREKTVKVTDSNGTVMNRRLDIVDVSNAKGVEVKSGNIYHDEAIRYEIARDRLLVEADWDINWHFDGYASRPLLNALNDAGIPWSFRDPSQIPKGM